MTFKRYIEKLENKTNLKTAGDVDNLLREMFKEVIQ